jgi:hypothetical protein
MMRTVLFLNALVALFSCTGLSMNFVSVFQTPVGRCGKKYKAENEKSQFSFFFSLSRSLNPMNIAYRYVEVTLSQCYATAYILNAYSPKL